VWSRVKTESAPQQRYAVAMYQYKAYSMPDGESAYQIFLLGGSQASSLQSPFLWTVNYFTDPDATSFWASSMSSGPSMRAYFSVLQFAKPSMFLIFGGVPPLSVTALNDLWIYISEPGSAGTWIQRCGASSNLPPRAGYAAISTPDNKVIVYGGWDDMTHFPLGGLNSMLTISLWDDCPYTTQTVPDLPGLAQVASDSAIFPRTNHLVGINE
jgi:hypothetical protein